MSYITTLQRIPAKLAKKIAADPGVVDTELEAESVDLELYKLIRFLRVSDNRELASLLEKPDPAESAGGIELVLYTPSAVRKIVRLAAAIDLGAAAGVARASKDGDGKLYYARDSREIDLVVRQVRAAMPLFERAASASEAFLVLTL